MLKKKYRLQKQLIIRQAYVKTKLFRILLSSLGTNVLLAPHVRLSFLMTSTVMFNSFNFFRTYQKLHCLVSMSTKVPTKSYHYSRFFLNKQLSFLTIANTLK
jgi:hypothetical protein